MRAVVITKPGGPDVLKVQDVADLTPQRGEARIAVKAVGINRADLLQRMGKYPAPSDCPASIPGLEYAGVIDAVGPGVTEVSVGDRVLGLVGGGSYAEQVVVHARTICHMPSNLSFAQAAALPEAFITAYDAMVTQCRLAAGETVLLSAVASGVGTAAVQIARAIGARTIGTTRTAQKLERVMPLGLDHGIVLAEPEFADRVNEITAGEGVDVVLELVGGDYVKEDLKCMRGRGRLIVVGLLAGRTVDFDLGVLLSRRYELRGTTLRARPLEEKIAAARMFDANLLPLVEAGALKPIIDKEFPFAQAGEAHAFVESNESFGKVILTL
jgi:putative PIG3 family NAD(P)H quinone oxidoreductase